MMKKVILSITAFVVAIGLTFGQSKTVTDFQERYKNDRDATVLHLNSGLFKLLASIATFDLDDEDAEVIGRISDNVRSMDILTVPFFDSGLTPQGFGELRNDLLDEQYEQLMEIREGRDNITFLSQGSENEVRNMVILAREDDRAVVMNINGTLNMKDLAYLAKQSKRFN